MDFATVKNMVMTNAVPYGLRLVGATLAWLAGRFFIRLMRRLLRAAGTSRKVDATVVRYVDSATHIVLTALLVLAVLGIFGIETTSFAGLLAAAGVAIGIAWSGLLANFAAGVFILTLEPFRVGDLVSVAGVTGTVQEIGMFNTAIDTADNVRTWVGNAKVFGDNIQNFSANGWRRVEVRVPLPAGIELLAGLKALRELAETVPDAMKEPPPTVEVVAVDGHGVVSIKIAAAARRYAEASSALNRSVALWLRAPAASGPPKGPPAKAS
jgi:small conductance mechanosensitive channel